MLHYSRLVNGNASILYDLCSIERVKIGLIKGVLITAIENHPQQLMYWPLIGKLQLGLLWYIVPLQIHLGDTVIAINYTNLVLTYMRCSFPCQLYIINQF